MQRRFVPEIFEAGLCQEKKLCPGSRPVAAPSSRCGAAEMASAGKHNTQLNGDGAISCPRTCSLSEDRLSAGARGFSAHWAKCAVEEADDGRDLAALFGAICLSKTTSQAHAARNM